MEKNQMTTSNECFLGCPFSIIGKCQIRSIINGESVSKRDLVNLYLIDGTARKIPRSCPDSIKVRVSNGIPTIIVGEEVFKGL